jgi:hypothetical protein
VGFTRAGLVNTATVDAFCNAAVGGVISRNCYISRIFDQSGHNCPIYNSTVLNMPDYIVDPTHQGLPRFQKVWQGSAALTFLLDSNGGSAGRLTNLCTILTGSAQALFYAGNSSYTAVSSGQAGLMENIRASGPLGAMFAAYTGPPGRTAYGKCNVTPSLPCGGLDTEAQGPQANYTRTSNDDFIDIATTAGPTGRVNIWINGVQITTSEAIRNLVTKNRMAWGDAGDHSTPGPNISRSEAFFTVDLTSGQEAALYSNEPSALTHSEGTGNRLSLARMSSAGLVQMKGLAILLCSRM